MTRPFIRYPVTTNCLLALCLSLVQPSFGQQATEPPREADAIPAESAAIGIVVVAIDDEVKSAWRKDEIPALREPGLFVAKVLPGSPAARVGVKPMDILVARCDGKVLVNPQEFSDWVKALAVGRQYRVTVHRPVANEQGRMTWRKLSYSIEPATRAKVEEDALRYGYICVDDRWFELPFLDLSKPSSQTRPFVPPKERYYELASGSTMATSGASRIPAGARDITERVVSQKRREWEERLPRIAVGEHGKIIGCKVVQVLGQGDAIVEIGLDDLGWRIAVPDRYEWVRLTGVRTERLVDGRRATLDEPIAVIGTWHYTTTLGARKTIFLACPVELLRRGLSEEEVKQVRAWRESHERP